MPKIIGPTNVGEVLAAIYRSEINIRLEWVWDGGFTWVLVKSTPERYPRVWNDDTLDGAETLIQSDAGARAADAGQFLHADWWARGSEPTIEAAVTCLADAVTEHYPDSRFARLWQTAWPTDLPIS